MDVASLIPCFYFVQLMDPISQRSHAFRLSALAWRRRRCWLVPHNPNFLRPLSVTIRQVIPVEMPPHLQDPGVPCFFPKVLQVIEPTARILDNPRDLALKLLQQGLQHFKLICMAIVRFLSASVSCRTPMRWRTPMLYKPRMPCPRRRASMGNPERLEGQEPE
jgi:hypothetical protein